jgi:hypothetical protein
MNIRNRTELRRATRPEPSASRGDYLVLIAALFIVIALLSGSIQ